MFFFAQQKKIFAIPTKLLVNSGNKRFLCNSFLPLKNKGKEERVIEKAYCCCKIDMGNCTNRR